MCSCVIRISTRRGCAESQDGRDRARKSTRVRIALDVSKARRQADVSARYGLKVEEWIAHAEALTCALEDGTVTTRIQTNFMALIQRMITFITKQEFDARRVKDPKQLEIALATLAKRKTTAQKPANLLADRIRNMKTVKTQILFR